MFMFLREKTSCVAASGSLMDCHSHKLQNYNHNFNFNVRTRLDPLLSGQYEYRRIIVAECPYGHVACILPVNVLIISLRFLCQRTTLFSISHHPILDEATWNARRFQFGIILLRLRYLVNTKPSSKPQVCFKHNTHSYSANCLWTTQWDAELLQFGIGLSIVCLCRYYCRQQNRNLVTFNPIDLLAFGTNWAWTPEYGV